MHNLIFSILLTSSELKVVSIVDLLCTTYFYEYYDTMYEEFKDETLIYEMLCSDNSN